MKKFFYFFIFEITVLPEWSGNLFSNENMFKTVRVRNNEVFKMLKHSNSKFYLYLLKCVSNI